MFFNFFFTHFLFFDTLAQVNLHLVLTGWILVANCYISVGFLVSSLTSFIVKFAQLAGPEFGRIRLSIRCLLPIRKCTSMRLRQYTVTKTTGLQDYKNSQQSKKWFGGNIPQASSQSRTNIASSPLDPTRTTKTFHPFSKLVQSLETTSYH